MRHDSGPMSPGDGPGLVRSGGEPEAPAPLRAELQPALPAGSSHPAVAYEEVIAALDGPSMVAPWCDLAAQLERRAGWAFGITADGAFPEWRFGSALGAGVLGPLCGEECRFVVWAFNRRGAEVDRWEVDRPALLAELLDDLERRPPQPRRRRRCASVGGAR